MRLSTQIKPISYVKANTAELLVRISREREPIIITQNGEARAVLMDIDSYEEMLVAVNPPKPYAPVQPQLIQSQLQTEEISSLGEAYSIDEAVAELRERRAGLGAGLEPVFG
jgi:prevent-host-death family protein